jgi:hypothetical protein
MQWIRTFLAWAGLSLLLGGMTLACGPSAGPVATPTTGDPFAVVRATSQAAYQVGKDYLDRGDLRGCPLIDTAKTNDPDNRAEIQQALEQCLAAIAALPAATSAPTPAQRTISVATLPAATPASATQPTPAAAQPTGAASQPTLAAAQLTSAALDKPTGAAAAKPTAAASIVAAAQATATPQAGAAQSLVTWRDPQGRFSISAPADWPQTDQAQTLFGTGVVEFHDPSGRAQLDVAVDTSSRVVSPELYAASIEITMQQQVPGYASEQVLPSATSNSPSIRRVFTFTQRDASGRDVQARGFQVTVLKGSTPYIISGSAPAEQFQQYSAMFDQIVETFRFS